MKLKCLMFSDKILFEMEVSTDSSSWIRMFWLIKESSAAGLSSLISLFSGNGAGHLVKTQVGPQHRHALRLSGAPAQVGDGE